MISQKDIECIIGKYFNKKHVLTDHQISSYNHLIDEILPNILNQIFPITVNDFNEKVQSIQLNLTKITVFYNGFWFKLIEIKKKQCFHVVL